MITGALRAESKCRTVSLGGAEDGAIPTPNGRRLARVRPRSSDQGVENSLSHRRLEAGGWRLNWEEAGGYRQRQWIRERARERFTLRLMTKGVDGQGAQPPPGPAAIHGSMGAGFLTSYYVPHCAMNAVPYSEAPLASSQRFQVLNSFPFGTGGSVDGLLAGLCVSASTTLYLQRTFSAGKVSWKKV